MVATDYKSYSLCLQSHICKIESRTFSNNYPSLKIDTCVHIILSTYRQDIMQPYINLTNYVIIITRSQRQHNSYDYYMYMFLRLNKKHPVYANCRVTIHQLKEIMTAGINIFFCTHCHLGGTVKQAYMLCLFFESILSFAS